MSNNAEPIEEIEILDGNSVEETVKIELYDGDDNDRQEETLGAGQKRPHSVLDSALSSEECIVIPNNEPDDCPSMPEQTPSSKKVCRRPGPSEFEARFLEVVKVFSKFKDGVMENPVPYTTAMCLASQLKMSEEFKNVEDVRNIKISSSWWNNYCAKYNLPIEREAFSFARRGRPRKDPEGKLAVKFGENIVAQVQQSSSSI